MVWRIWECKGRFWNVKKCISEVSALFQATRFVHSHSTLTQIQWAGILAQKPLKTPYLLGKKYICTKTYFTEHIESRATITCKNEGLRAILEQLGHGASFKRMKEIYPVANLKKKKVSKLIPLLEISFIEKSSGNIFSFLYSLVSLKKVKLLNLIIHATIKLF